MPRKKKFLRLPPIKLLDDLSTVVMSKRDLNLLKSIFSKHSTIDEKWEATVLVAGPRIRELTNRVEATLEESPSDLYLKTKLYADPSCSVKTYKESSKSLVEHIGNLFEWIKSDKDNDKLLTKNDDSYRGYEISSLPDKMMSEKLEGIFESDSEQYEDLFSLLLYSFSQQIKSSSHQLGVCKNSNCQSLFVKDGKRQFCTSTKCKQDYFNSRREPEKRKTQSPAYRLAQKRKPPKKQQ